MSVNKDGYEPRMAAIQRILTQHGLESTTVTPLAYSDDVPFNYNNYIYKIDLVSPALPSTFPSNIPGTTAPPPEGVTTLVARFSSPFADGMNNTNRVENEIAAAALVAGALAEAGLPPLVPAVYAWAALQQPPGNAPPPEDAWGWSLVEYKAGHDLDGVFAERDLATRKDLVRQIAAVLAAVQRVALPANVDKFGGLTFDESGAVVSGQSPLLKDGPWASYAEVWEARIKTQLEDADGSPVLDGWRVDGIRERIKRLLAAGAMDKFLDGVDTNLRVLTHGDFTMNNILCDPATNKLTALLDFDWAAVTHPADEFLSGFMDIGGGLQDARSKFQEAVITGDFSVKPDGLSQEDDEAWEIAKTWNTALVELGARTPSTFAGVRRIRSLRALESTMCPFVLTNKTLLARLSEERKVTRKQEAKEALVQCLNEHGF